MQTPSSMWHDCIRCSAECGAADADTRWCSARHREVPWAEVVTMLLRNQHNLRIETQYEKCGGKGGQY